MKPKLQMLRPRIAEFVTEVASKLIPRSGGDPQARKRFYDSVVWQNTRAAKLRRDPICQCCIYDGIVTEAVHVDHWKPLAEGGHPTDDQNLVSLCASCHSRKTQCEMNGTALPFIVPSCARAWGVA